jgi:hypothetical protein
MKNYILQIAGSVCLLMSRRSGSMKSKLVAMAGGLAYVFIAVISMPVHAEEIHTAVSGSSISLGVDADGNSLGSVARIPSLYNSKKMGKSIIRTEIQQSGIAVQRLYRIRATRNRQNQRSRRVCLMMR